MSNTNGNVRKRNMNLEVIEAKNYLRNNLPPDDEDLHFINLTYKGVCPRYHFYKGEDTTIIYTVVSKEERESAKIEETFAV